MNYSKEEILEIIRVNHLQRMQIQIGFPKVEEINFDLTIRNWIDDFELLSWGHLCKYYSTFFEIEEFKIEFQNAMDPIKKKTLRDFCEFVSSRAIKPKIEPIKLFGRECEEAGIFRYLKNKLAVNDKRAFDIKPSSKLKEYMNDFAFNIVAEISKINSQALPLIKYKQNQFYEQSWKLFLSSQICLILAFLFQSWLIGGIGLGLIISEFWMNKIAYKLPAEIFEFEEIETFRELIERVKNHGMQQSAKRR